MIRANLRARCAALLPLHSRLHHLRNCPPQTRLRRTEIRWPLSLGGAGNHNELAVAETVGLGAEHGFDLGRNLGNILVEYEMPSIEPDQLGVGQVLQIGARPGRNEKGVVLAPDDQGLRCMRPEGRLPFGIERDIALVVFRRST